jgi:hypothetical protein
MWNSADYEPFISTKKTGMEIGLAVPARLLELMRVNYGRTTILTSAHGFNLKLSLAKNA